MTVAEETLTTQASTQNGHDLTAHFTQMSYDGATLPNGSKFLNDGNCVILARTSTSRTLTIVGQRKGNYGVLTSVVVTCATGVHIIGPLSPQHFNDNAGYCHITWNGTSANDYVVVLAKGVAKG
jgi:hypothetical protein